MTTVFQQLFFFWANFCSFPMNSNCYKKYVTRYAPVFLLSYLLVTLYRKIHQFISALYEFVFYPLNVFNLFLSLLVHLFILNVPTIPVTENQLSLRKICENTGFSDPCSRIFPYNDKIVDSLLIRENKG